MTRNSTSLAQVFTVVGVIVAVVGVTIAVLDYLRPDPALHPTRSPDWKLQERVSGIKSETDDIEKEIRKTERKLEQYQDVHPFRDVKDELEKAEEELSVFSTTAEDLENQQPFLKQYWREDQPGTILEIARDRKLGDVAHRYISVKGRLPAIRTAVEKLQVKYKDAQNKHDLEKDLDRLKAQKKERKEELYELLNKTD